MNQIIKENRLFLVSYSVLFMFCISLYTFYSKSELHIITNSWNSRYLDIFFKYLTFMGDGVWVAVLFIVLLFIRYRFAFAFLTGSLISAIIVNLLKKVILEDVFRPVKYFEIYETYKLHLVEGVKMNMLQSFPSGHSATAFNLFFMLALLVKNDSMKFILFVLASLVAYSRIYLSQHFLVDTIAGSFIGIISILPVYVYYLNMKPDWLDKSILRR